MERTREPASAPLRRPCRDDADSSGHAVSARAGVCLRSAGWLTLLLGLVVAGTGDLLAQEGAGRGVALPTESEYQVLWQRLEQSRQREDWTAVLNGLESYADLLQRVDVNPVITSGGGLALGLRRLLRAVPASLPEQERARFQERLDAVIQQVWDESRERHSAEEHRILRHRLLRDYPSTSLRTTILKEDIDEAFADGRLEAARTRCEALLALEKDGELAGEDQARARLYLLQILALEGADPTALQEQIVALQALAARPGSELSENVREQIATVVSLSSSLSQDLTSRVRGLPHRALELRHFQDSEDVPESEYRIGKILWRESVGSPHLRRFIEERARVSPDAQTVLPYHSAQNDAVIVFQHLSHLVAVDRRKHETLWKRPLAPESENSIGLRVPLLGSRHCFYVNGSQLGALLLEDGSEAWTVAVSYDVEAKRPRFSRRRPTPAGANPAAAPQTDTPEARTESLKGPEEDKLKPEDPPGAQQNDEAAADGRAPDTTEGVARLTPAVFYHDRIVVGLRLAIDGESLHFLASFTTNGRHLWTSFLGSVASDDYLGLGSTGSVPLIAHDTIYYLTNQGFVVAADPIDGVLLWISEYDRLEASGQREAIRRADRWQPNPLLEIGRTLVIAPQDSPFLIALRRDDGSFSWRAPRQRHGTLIGADSRACFVAGAEVAAIAHSGEERGQVLWRYDGEPDEDGNRQFLPLGRATLAGDVILLSGRQALVRLAAADGQVLSKTLWSFESGGGNLLLSADSAAVTTPEGLFIYGARDDPATYLTAELETLNHPALLARAHFYLRNSAIDKGLAALRRWSETNPPSPVANSELDHLQLDLAEMCRFFSETRDGVSRRQELVRARLALERNPQRKVTSAIQLAELLLERDDKAGALELFHVALAHDSPPTDYSPDGLLVVRSEAYLRERIARLRRETTGAATTFASVDAAAAEALADARKNGTPPAYTKVLRRYPYSEAAGQAYLDLFTCHQDRKNYGQGLKTLQNYLRDFEPGQPRSVPRAGEDVSTLVRVKLILANMLYQARRGPEARAQYRQVLASYGDLRIDGVRDMTQGETVRQYVELRLRDPGLRDLPDTRESELRLPLRMAWRAPAELAATHRTFLEPTGPRPPQLERCFLTQAASLIECRNMDTGLPRWRLHLDMIPGFETEPMARLRSRTGPRAFRAAFIGELLVLQDNYNVLALDADQGHVRWHVPFGNQDPARRGATNPLRRLRESVRGSTVSREGVFVASSRMLYRYRAEGERVWQVELDYDAGLQPLFVRDNDLIVFSQRPMGIRVHDTATGELRTVLGTEEGLGRRLLSHPILTSKEHLLLHFERELSLFDLATKKVRWTFKTERKAHLEGVSYFPEAPDESVIVVRRQNNWPAMVGVSLVDGRERWRYEKFPVRDGSFSVFRDGDQFFVIHGDDQWHLLALELRSGPGIIAPSLVPIWPNEIRLGHFYAGSSSRRLHVASDAVLFADANGTAVRIFDRARGVRRASDARVIGRFLVEKRSFASSRIADKLILLTDNGDAAFEPVARGPSEGQVRGVDIAAVDRFLSKPGDFDTTKQLALEYFRDDKLDSALRVLNRSLLSEDLLIRSDRNQRELLKLLLDGIQQENMKRSVPEIACRRMHSPPKIDGELNDAWHVTHSIRLNSPTNIGSIPTPGQVHEWDGREDLSAILYTGWDENYFYFALDVRDDILIPFDRDAENWTGDCLVMGIDPTGDGGYRHRGNDQLMTLALTVPRRKLDKDKDDEEDGDDEDEEEEESEEDEGKPDGQFSVKKKGDDSGAIYEVALPWETFSKEFENGNGPAKGYTFGLSLLLTDDDTLHGNQGQGATKTLSINPCHLLPRNQTQGWVWRYLIPNFFPKVRLE